MSEKKSAEETAKTKNLVLIEFDGQYVLKLIDNDIHELSIYASRCNNKLHNSRLEEAQRHRSEFLKMCEQSIAEQKVITEAVRWCNDETDHVELVGAVRNMLEIKTKK